MAMRKRLNHDDKTRKKIQATQLVNRLNAHIMGEIELTQSQVRSIEILLKKCLPDLQSIEQNIQGEQAVYLVSDEPMTADEWIKQYSVDTANGAAESTH